ncbi:MAG: phosphate ABC transporter permease subunit PstC [Candidatus Coatesbacteria bacterium]
MSPSVLALAGPRWGADDAFRRMTLAFGLVIVGLAVAMGGTMAVNSRLAWRAFGLPFIWTSTWDPVAEVFGAWPFIWGTLVSSALALSVAVPLGLGTAVFLAEVAPRRLSDAASFAIELLAAIPTVIMGLMGIFILVPLVRWAEPWLARTLGFLPFFRGAPYGVGMLTAGLLLAFIILPYIVSITREIMLTVPRSLREAALGLGATKWEVVRLVVFPYARSGVTGAVFLALGRALGETMAVTMVIGNTPKVSLSLLEPGYSMAAVLANEFAEASSDLYVHSLVAIGLVLFGITIVVNAIARLMIHRATVRAS